MHKKSASFILIAPVIAVVAVGVWFFGFNDDGRSLLDGYDRSSSGQIDTLSGNTIIGYTDEGDTLEDIGLGDDYTSPWFADIDMVAGQWIALVDQGDNNFMRQKQCRMAEEWEQRMSIFTTDTSPSKDSSWSIRLMDRRAEEYRISDFRYDGDDHTRFIIDAIDEDAEPATTTQFFIYRDSPGLLQLRNAAGMVTWYTSDALQDDYSVSECVKE